jgi:hypothetical protein
MSRLTRSINNIGGQLFGCSYYRTAVRTKLLLSGRQEPIVVWQMGKVGSSSILYSLHNSRLNSAVFRVHVLSDDLIARGELIKKSAKQGTMAHLNNVALREQLLSGNRRWKIISVVREPVGRNISAFFQNLDLYTPDIAPDDISQVQVLQNTFFNDFDHERPLIWFDYELKSLLGIDVYSKPFLTEQGYAEYFTELYDLLILRMEDLNTIGTQALKRFLNMPEFELVQANIGSEKNYANVYAKLRGQIDIPRAYLERMYESKYARHFYSASEIDQLYARWSKAAA